VSRQTKARIAWFIAWATIIVLAVAEVHQLHGSWISWLVIAAEFAALCAVNHLEDRAEGRDR
jgi:hypothetical protein